LSARDLRQLAGGLASLLGKLPEPLPALPEKHTSVVVRAGAGATGKRRAWSSVAR
jgi:hypothetical protein